MKWKIVTLTLALVSSSACTMMGSAPYQSEDQKSSLYLQADSQALATFFEGINGAAQVAKDDKNKIGAYWVQRESSDKLRALRFNYRKQEAAK